MIKLACLAAVATVAVANTVPQEEQESSEIQRRESYTNACIVRKTSTMWKGHPCSSESAGTLAPGRILFYAGSSMKTYNGHCQTYCAVDNKPHPYIKLVTQSGKSVGWVNYDALDCAENPYETGCMVVN